MSREAMLERVVKMWGESMLGKRMSSEAKEAFNLLVKQELPKDLESLAQEFAMRKYLASMEPEFVESLKLSREALEGMGVTVPAETSLTMKGMMFPHEGRSLSLSEWVEGQKAIPRRRVRETVEPVVEETAEEVVPGVLTADQAWDALKSNEDYKHTMWSRIVKQRGRRGPAYRHTTGPEYFKSMYRRWREGGDEYIDSLRRKPREKRELQRALEALGLMGVGAAAVGLASPREAEASRWMRPLSAPKEEVVTALKDGLEYLGLESELALKVADKTYRHKVDDTVRGAGRYLRGVLQKHNINRDPHGNILNVDHLDRFVNTTFDRLRPSITPVTKEQRMLNRLRRMFGSTEDIPWRQLKRKDPAAAARIKQSGVLGGGEQKLSQEVVERALTTEHKYKGELLEWTGPQNISRHFGGEGKDSIMRVDLGVQHVGSVEHFRDVLKRELTESEWRSIRELFEDYVAESAETGNIAQYQDFVLFLDAVRDNPEVAGASRGIERALSVLRSERARPSVSHPMSADHPMLRDMSPEARNVLQDALVTGEGGMHPGGIGWVRYYDHEGTRIIGEVQSDVEEYLLRKAKEKSLDLRRVPVSADIGIKIEQLWEMYIYEPGATGTWNDFLSWVERDVSRDGPRHLHSDVIAPRVPNLRNFDPPITPNRESREALKSIKDWREQAIAGVIQDAKDKGIEKVFIPSHEVVQEYNVMPSARKYNTYYKDPMKKIGGFKEGSISAEGLVGEKITAGQVVTRLQQTGVTDYESWGIADVVGSRIDDFYEGASRAEISGAIEAVRTELADELHTPLLNTRFLENMMSRAGMNERERAYIRSTFSEYVNEWTHEVADVGAYTIDDFRNYLGQEFNHAEGSEKIRALDKGLSALERWESFSTEFPWLSWDHALRRTRNVLREFPSPEKALVSKKGFTRSTLLALPAGIGLYVGLTPHEAAAAQEEQNIDEIAKRYGIRPEQLSKALEQYDLKTTYTPSTPPPLSEPLGPGEQPLDVLHQALEAPEGVGHLEAALAPAALLGTGIAKGLALPFRGMTFPSETLTALGGPPEHRDPTLTDLMTGNMPLTEYAEPDFTIGKYFDSLEKGVLDTIAPNDPNVQAMGEYIYEAGVLSGELASLHYMLRSAGWLRESIWQRHYGELAESGMKARGMAEAGRKAATVGPLAAATYAGSGRHPGKEAAFWGAFELVPGVIGTTARVMRPITRTFTWPLKTLEKRVTGPLWEWLARNVSDAAKKAKWPETILGRTAFRSEIPELAVPGTGSLYELATSPMDRMPKDVRRVFEKQRASTMEKMRVSESLSKTIDGFLTNQEQRALNYIIKGEKPSGGRGRAHGVFKELGITDPERQREVRNAAQLLKRFRWELGLEYATTPIMRRTKSGLREVPILRQQTLVNNLKHGVGVFHWFDFPKEALKRRAKEIGKSDLAKLEVLSERFPQIRSLLNRLNPLLEETAERSPQQLRNISIQLRHASRKMDLPEAAREILFGHMSAAERAYKGFANLATETERARIYATLNRMPQIVKQTEAQIPKGLRHRFVQMPNDVKWGMLRGKYVNRDVAAEIHEMTRLPSSFMNWYGKWFMRPWKVGKVLIRPSTHFRNMMSNGILNYLGGLPPWRMDIYAKAAREYKTKGKLWREAVDQGALGREFFGHDLRLDPYLREGNIIDAGLRMASKYSRLAGKAYQAEEQVFKLGKYIHNLEQGMTKRGAAEDALKWTLNYADVSPIIRGARDTIMPFATFIGKAIPVIMESAVRTPWRIGALTMAMYGMTSHSLSRLNVKDDEWRRLRDSLPDYVQRGHFMLLPWKDADGRMQWLDLTYILPWGDIAELGQHGIFYPFQNPLLTIYSEIRSNQTFSGRPIWYEWMTPGEKAQRALYHIYQQMMPSFWLFGYDWNKGEKAGVIPHLERIGTEGPLFERSEAPGSPTPGQWAASQFGLKTFARGESELVYQKSRQLRFLERQVKGEARREMREYPSQSERSRRRARQRMMRLREYFGGDLAQ